MVRGPFKSTGLKTIIWNLTKEKNQTKGVVLLILIWWVREKVVCQLGMPSGVTFKLYTIEWSTKQLINLQYLNLMIQKATYVAWRKVSTPILNVTPERALAFLSPMKHEGGRVKLFTSSLFRLKGCYAFHWSGHTANKMREYGTRAIISGFMLGYSPI